jgi:predicted metal-dependent hydrolase
MPTVATDQRSIVLDGHTVTYQLRRSTRRTIGLAIDHRGLRVGAPSRARLGDIESLIRQHGQWVLDKLANWRERPPVALLTLTDGCELDILGQTRRISLIAAPRSSWQITDDTLFLYQGPAVDAAQLLEKALREHAREVFLQRLARHAPGLGVDCPPLRLSSARTRWGSCSARGGIALNWRLIFMPLPVVDYVVCHELAHLKEMNHSPRFWSVVEQLCPDWRALRLELRHRGQHLPRFA